MILVEDCELYTPQAMGLGKVLISGGTIAAVGTDFGPPPGLDVEVISAKGLLAIPGLIDGHVHIAGAGGEGGPATRTRELAAAELLNAGITTAIGCLGTDGLTRTVASLLMKAKGLRQEGLSCWIYTGSYQVPPPTITGEVATDLCYIEEIIGVGEIALADHRSSSPGVLDLVRLAKLTRLGGMLSGKVGIVHVHMGDSPRPFELIEEAVAASELGFKQFYPTHVNRNRHIFEDAKKYGREGFLDITSGIQPTPGGDEIEPAKALAGLLAAGVPLDHLTMSSDAGGSLPCFDEQGHLTGMEVGMPGTLLQELRNLVDREGLPLEKALRTVTANPAAILKLPGKGSLAAGMDADLLLVDRGLAIRYAIAGGRVTVGHGS